MGRQARVLRDLSRTLTVARVDHDIPTEEQGPDRKPWFIALVQKANFNPDLSVPGLPASRTILLSEEDVLRLVDYLLEPQTAVWAENPSTGGGHAQMFDEPGMVGLADSEDGVTIVVNGEAHWTPEYFKQQKPVTERRRRINTLPWPLPPSARTSKAIKLPAAKPGRQTSGQKRTVGSTSAKKR